MLQEDDEVRVRDFRGGEKWTVATIIRHLGPVTYLIRECDRRCSVHIDHLLPRRREIKELEQYLPVEVRDLPAARPVSVYSSMTGAEKPTVTELSSKNLSRESPADAAKTIPHPSGNNHVAAGIPVMQQRRNPERLRSAPQRLDL